MFDLYEISTCCTSERVAEVENELDRAGAISISFRNGAASNAATAINADWSVAQITALLPKQTNLPEIKAVLSNIGCQQLRTRSIEESEWTRNLVQPTHELTVGPFAIGERLPSARSAHIPLEISAGLAFGTGSHDTTSLCLEWLAKHDLNGKNVLDLGCGSGILAIAAMKLGALSATAIDNDQTALTVTKENAVKNGIVLSVSDRLDLTSRFDVVVCNIYADTLIQYAEDVQRVLKSHAILAFSGIMEHQYEHVAQAYVHVRFGPAKVRNEWVLLSGTTR